jgi:hypothetical protein
MILHANGSATDRSRIVPTAHVHPRQAFEPEHGVTERTLFPALTWIFSGNSFSAPGLNAPRSALFSDILGRLHSMRVPKNKADQGICREQAVVISDRAATPSSHTVQERFMSLVIVAVR